MRSHTLAILALLSNAILAIPNPGDGYKIPYRGTLSGEVENKALSSTRTEFMQTWVAYEIILEANTMASQAGCYLTWETSSWIQQAVEHLWPIRLHELARQNFGDYQRIIRTEYRSERDTVMQSYASLRYVKIIPGETEYWNTPYSPSFDCIWGVMYRARLMAIILHTYQSILPHRNTTTALHPWRVNTLINRSLQIGLDTQPDLETADLASVQQFSDRVIEPIISVLGKDEAAGNWRAAWVFYRREHLKRQMKAQLSDDINTDPRSRLKAWLGSMLSKADQEQLDEQFKNESDELWAITESLSRKLLNIEQKTFQAFCVLFGMYGYEQAAASRTNPLDDRNLIEVQSIQYDEGDTSRPNIGLPAVQPTFLISGTVWLRYYGLSFKNKPNESQI